jgi:hypothetical protein
MASRMASVGRVTVSLRKSIGFSACFMAVPGAPGLRLRCDT